MEDKPKIMECNYCGRKVSDDKSITWIPLKGLGENEGIWSAKCRYCRGIETKKRKRHNS